MTTPTFDTLRIAQALKDAGFDDSQSQAIVSAIRLSLGENVATKVDIADVKMEMADLRTMIATEVAGVRTEIAASEARMVKWLAGLLIGTALGSVTATVALIKLLE